MSIDLSERAYAMDTADKLLVRVAGALDKWRLMTRLSERQIGRSTSSTSIHLARYTGYAAHIDQASLEADRTDN